ncbi:MAG: flagellar motor protein [Terriglobales bacterium]
MDKSSWAGIVVAAGGIVGGMVMEGGKVAQILQPTAAMIVFGGTLGAVMLQFPLATVLDSFRALPGVFFPRGEKLEARLAQIVVFAQKARKQGIVSLDADLGTVADPFLKKSLMLAIDGTDSQDLRNIMELEMDHLAEHDERCPKVFEAAGGYSPTVGILGAVLGLIEVMQHLNNINEVGRGIAVAFVATIYGVAAANLFYLPVAGKLKHYAEERNRARQMVLEGTISILEGMNPRMLETKLRAFCGTQAPQAEAAGARDAAPELAGEPSQAAG